VAQREGVEEAVRLVRDAEKAAGRAPGSTVIDLRLEACIADDEGAAIAAMRRRFAARLLATFPHWDYLDRLRVTVTAGLQAAGEARDLEAMMANLPDDAVRATALVGSAERVAEQVRSLLALDVGKITIRPYPCAGQELEATMLAFAERVWPAATAGLAAPTEV
jgi:alkanesulfonate monooxygenase SsuD/methylene tetrahydromethanopterin reductase-like flavin-dependent oxidoreductase (luciferase family)